MIANFALKARVTLDDNAFALFRNAFTTSLTADGSALISTHTLLNGSTFSNLVTGALSPTTLKTAIQQLRESKDQAGIILGCVPSVLLVPEAMFPHALEITNSALIADVANNNVNVFRSTYGIEVWSSPYLGAAAGGSDTAWFLLAKNHSVTRLIRQGIVTSLRDWSLSNNRTYFYQANMRETVYCPDYIGIVASTGVYGRTGF